MIYIIEGPDGSGKSTLAKYLAKTTGMKLIHRSYPKTQEEKDNMLAEYKELIKNNVDCILDRCWYSEMIYGPVMRDDDVFSEEAMHDIETELTKIGAMIIYCTGNMDTLWNRCASRGEDYVTTLEQYRAIYYGYKELFEYTAHLIPVVTYSIREYEQDM